MPYTRRTQGPGQHGHTKNYQQPPTYRIWCAMIQRCLNPNCREYHYYGGRGIKICARWLEKNGYMNFLTDVGEQPFKRASLNRLDNNGDYEPGNVAWATAQVQCNNRRSNHLLTFRGRTKTIADWARHKGIKLCTLVARIWRGDPIGKALTRKVAKRKPYAEWVRRKQNPLKPGRKPNHESSKDIKELV